VTNFNKIVTKEISGGIMKRNKLYILLTLIITVILFGTAAICTQCGASIDEAIGDLGGFVEGESPGTEPGGEQPSDTEPGETPPGDEPPYEDNHPPAIEEIETMGVDVEYAEAEGMFEDLPADPDIEGIPDIIFSIEAYDEDGDELQYSAYDSLGAEFDVTKIDNNNAEFFWELSEEPGPYTLTMEVSDGRGGTDSQSVNMTFIEPPEGTEWEGISEARLDVVPEETGQIANNEDWATLADIYIGDGGGDRYVNGYISFNITYLAGVEVVSATLTMDLDRECGDRSYLGNLRIGTLDYGTGPFTVPSSVSIRDIPAKLLIQLPNSTTDVSYSSNELADELQKNINAASDRFQLKIYWSHPHTDEDGIADGLLYLQGDIYLIVQYTE